MEKIETVLDLPYDPIGSYRNGNPYTIAFVYCKNGAKFVVKGGLNDVTSYINRVVHSKAMIHETLWKGGKTGWTRIRFIGFPEDIYMWKREQTFDSIGYRKKPVWNKKHWELRSDGKVIKRYRRPPRDFPNILR